LIAALAEADADDSIDNITLSIDSPGGQFDGLFDALAAIQKVKKPVKAVISNLGASAAFAIASQADEIIATNRAARIGSVGVVATFDIDADEISITSTEAPNKRPDVTTSAGVDMVRQELDAMHQLFVESIAEGRNTTVSRVNAEFGRGATLLADEALKRGMIDAIASSSNVKTTTATSGNQPEAIKMDLKQLQAQHPETYAAAVLQGETTERDRVLAHLTAGEMSGDVKTASEAIKAGSAMTMTLQTQYMMAAANRGNVDDRDNDDASAADNVDENPNAAATESDQVIAMVKSQLGFDEEL
jgi:ClpP class serine protease